MHGMSPAKAAVFLHLQAIWIVFLVLHRIVISLLTLITRKRYLYAHIKTSISSRHYDTNNNENRFRIFEISASLC